MSARSNRDADMVLILNVSICVGHSSAFVPLMMFASSSSPASSLTDVWPNMHVWR